MYFLAECERDWEGGHGDRSLKLALRTQPTNHPGPWTVRRVSAMWGSGDVSVFAQNWERGESSAREWTRFGECALASCAVDYHALLS